MPRKRRDPRLKFAMLSRTDRHLYVFAVFLFSAVGIAIWQQFFPLEGRWTFLPVALVFLVCGYSAHVTRESGIAVLYACLTAVLVFDIGPSDAGKLLVAALTEHRLLLKVVLISIAVALLSRVDFLEAARGLDAKSPKVIRAELFCKLRGWARVWGGERSSKPDLAPSFIRSFFSLLPPTLPGLADPSDAAKTASCVWTESDFEDPDQYPFVKTGILCCSTFWSLLPFSMWILTFAMVTQGLVLGIQVTHVPVASSNGPATELAKSAGEIVTVPLAGSTIPQSIFCAAIIPLVYGLLSYLHGVSLVRRAGPPHRKKLIFGHDTKNITSNRFRNTVYILCLLVMFAVAGFLPGSSAESGVGVAAGIGHHSPIDGLVHGFDNWYIYLLVALIGALLVARAATEYQMAIFLRDPEKEEKDWHSVQEVIKETASACLTVFILFFFYFLNKHALKDLETLPLVLGLPIAIIALFAVIRFAGEPYLVFMLPYLILSKTDDIDDWMFPLVQCLLLAAAFSSQFSPMTLSIEYLYGGSVRSWPELRSTTKVSSYWGWSPFCVQCLLLVVCGVLAFPWAWWWRQ